MRFTGFPQTINRETSTSEQCGSLNDNGMDGYRCDCIEKAFVMRMIKGGRRVSGTQCSRCGRFSAVRKSLIPLGIVLKEFDQRLFDDFNEKVKLFYERKSLEYSRQRETKNREWWTWYNSYLQTEKWRSKRTLVLQRDKFVCQACLSRDATEVHHLTYEHVGHEPLFELTSICKKCHDYITKMNREK